MTKRLIRRAQRMGASTSLLLVALLSVAAGFEAALGQVPTEPKLPLTERVAGTGSSKSAGVEGQPRLGTPIPFDDFGLPSMPEDASSKASLQGAAGPTAQTAWPQVQREALRRRLKADIDRVLLTQLRSVRRGLHRSVDKAFAGPEQLSAGLQAIRLKAKIDLQLVPHVTALKRDLHRTVDRALRSQDPGDELSQLLASMEAEALDRLSGAATPSTTEEIPSPREAKIIDPDLSRRIGDLERGLAQLKESLGAHHPYVAKLAKTIAAQKRELLGLGSDGQSTRADPIEPSLLGSTDPAKLVDDMMKSALKEVIESDPPSQGGRRLLRKNIP